MDNLAGITELAAHAHVQEVAGSHLAIGEQGTYLLTRVLDQLLC